MRDKLLEDIIGGLGITEEGLEEHKDLVPENLEPNKDEELEEEDEEDGDEFLDVDNFEFKPEAPDKEEKANHAFAELRRANREKEEELKRLSNLAEAYGFKNYEEMVEQLETEAMDKKAKEENVDPKIYRRLHENERELEKLKKQREEEFIRAKVNKVVDRIDGFLKDNNLTEKHKEKLLEALDADGFTIEDLSKINNPNRLFKGYVADDINESKAQKELEREAKRKQLEEEKFRGTGVSDEYSIDDLITNMIASRTSNY